MSGTGCKRKHGVAIITRSRDRSQRKRKERGEDKEEEEKEKEVEQTAKVMRLLLPLSSKNSD